MIGKMAGWALIVFLCLVLMAGIFWWRILVVGADSYRTTIELQNTLTTRDLEILGDALDGALNTTCKNQNDAQVCFRWRVGELGDDSVYVEVREFGEATRIIVNSFPYYLFGIGPSWIRQDHIEVESFLESFFADRVKSVFRRRLPE